MEDEVTGLLNAWRDGKGDALQELLPLVYQELRRLAHHHMRGERPGHTLQTTAVIHEAYMKLIDQRAVDWQSRAHFFAVASQLMRRILVHHARGRAADKRGFPVRKLTTVTNQSRRWQVTPGFASNIRRH